MNSGIPPKTYEFQRVVFGISSSPFQAQFVSHYNAKKHMHELGLAAETVLKSCYMDDCLDSVDSVEKALNLYHELIELWGRANMLARKWMSNSTEVLEKYQIKIEPMKLIWISLNYLQKNTWGYLASR